MTPAIDHLRFVLASVTEALKTQDLYNIYMTNDIHALYSKAMSLREFIRDMSNLIETQLTEAWNKGSDESMVLPEDFTEDDKAVLQGIIDNEKSYLDNFANDIQNAAQDKSGWDQFSYRVDIWSNRYTDIQNQARIYYGGKIKYVWHLGQTEQHCDTCSKLDGIVAWAEEWDQSGIHPQAPPNPMIECGGWRCDCQLDSTTERRTNNALDTLTQIALEHAGGL